jgi:hypothetical protein
MMLLADCVLLKPGLSVSREPVTGRDLRTVNTKSKIGAVRSYDENLGWAARREA